MCQGLPLSHGADDVRGGEGGMQLLPCSCLSARAESNAANPPQKGFCLMFKRTAFDLAHARVICFPLNKSFSRWHCTIGPLDHGGV